MSVLLVLAGLVLLVSPGLGLECVQCTDNYNTSCSGNVKNCSGEELCVSIITQSVAANGKRSFTFERDCGAAEWCNFTAAMSSLLSMQIRSTCCSTDSCTPPEPSLEPKVNKSSNEIQCPVCLSHSLRKCVASTVQNCTGDEKFCSLYELKNSAGLTFIKGCASESFCRAPQRKKLENGKLTMGVIKCGSDALQTPLLLLIALLGTLTCVV
ncbi:phospholipase A2 inhibitor and Ly6/PLAUR domain-containing protein-like [Engystomops pustulosus]|uniref:phospholipase A2 inhibitor and Ly6/PLAUR domain-containing protein-like n=1 Tax=Engystomops pustulosus TaxID=76066 RepID=UPI003AFABD71